ncbi:MULTISPECIES: DUF2169 domain-containing protein [unclassified Pseudomonas]|uniref:DUF2169 family type VI secretion system accessory protein n=1 Tax=unclassified Pseudomonas TaxID=196821 RepID=UPI002447D4F9|nr:MULTISPECIES: DUF2169 domain-containing protein [unclassified Pseudomonas]MDH0897727.1 DUF2169 domain-containing protein [Pseudomonas sp. GD03875]MDH1067880.1 DUF2169 domain-containing protein [Pseudomonas sp. GD03985]
MILGEVENCTPYAWFTFEKMGPAERLYDIVIVKAACVLRPGRGGEGIVALDEAAPIHLADEHFGAPERSPLRIAGDTLLYKPGTDVFFRGHARPLQDLPEQWAADLEIGTRRHRWRLSGERHWQWSLMRGWHLSAAQPCEILPLRYELAFGGSYTRRGEVLEHAENPVGRGWLDANHLDREQHYPAPRIEHFAHPVSEPGRPIPIPGLGPIPRYWTARSRYAGTYDDAWKERFNRGENPGYPRDFDPRFFQAAHPDWQFEQLLVGGEAVALVGLTGDEPLLGNIPGWRVEALLVGTGAPVVAPLRLDTLDFDLDAQRLYMTWRLPIPQDMGIRQVVLRRLPKETS